MNNSSLVAVVDTFKNLLYTMRGVSFAIKFSSDDVFEQFPAGHSETCGKNPRIQHWKVMTYNAEEGKNRRGVAHVMKADVAVEYVDVR